MEEPVNKVVNKQEVVIVGGGYAGVYLALHLLKADIQDFLLINQSDVFHNNFASVRAIVQPGFAKNTLIPLAKTFRERFLCGTVKELNPEAHALTLDSGLIVEYTYLVIATGRLAGWPFKIGSLKEEEACRKYDNLAKSISECKNVTLIGAGATGVETAAEIASAKDINPQVTLIHSSDAIISSRIPEECRKRTMDALTQMKVNLILGDKVTDLEQAETSNPREPIKLSTEKGKEIITDMVIDCTGRMCSRNFYHRCLGHSVHEYESIKVDECLRVCDQEDMFAIGDCNDVREPKLGYLAGAQGKYLGSSLENLIKFSKHPIPYTPDLMPFTLMVTLGKKSGMIIERDGCCTWNGGYVLTNQKTLLNDMFWEDLRQNTPATSH